MNARNTAMIRDQSVPSDAKLQQVRNVGVAAHIDAGKTTFTERILLYTGAIHKAGNVDDGNTTTDFDPIEQRKGITIFAAAVSCSWTQQVQENWLPLLVMLQLSLFQRQVCRLPHSAAKWSPGKVLPLRFLGVGQT